MRIHEEEHLGMIVLVPTLFAWSDDCSKGIGITWLKWAIEFTIDK